MRGLGANLGGLNSNFLRICNWAISKIQDHKLHRRSSDWRVILCPRERDKERTKGYSYAPPNRYYYYLLSKPIYITLERGLSRTRMVIKSISLFTSILHSLQVIINNHLPYLFPIYTLVFHVSTILSSGYMD
jgi:hypothetical protein